MPSGDRVGGDMGLDQFANVSDAGGDGEVRVERVRVRVAGGEEVTRGDFDAEGDVCGGLYGWRHE